MEILNQFGINPVLLAAQVVNFLILLFLLKKFMYKPILKVLEERKKRIEDSLKNAEAIERNLQQTTDESEKIIGKTLKEAQKILDQTNETAAQILKDANKQAEQILFRVSEEGKKIAELQKEIMMGQVKKSAADLIALVFEKITGKTISKEDQQKILEKEIKNLS